MSEDRTNIRKFSTNHLHDLAYRLLAGFASQAVLSQLTPSAAGVICKRPQIFFSNPEWEVRDDAAPASRLQLLGLHTSSASK